jgi:hypothetical protein
VSFSIVLPGPSAGVKGQSHKAPLPTAHKTSIVRRNSEGFLHFGCSRAKLVPIAQIQGGLPAFASYSSKNQKIG